MHPLEAMYSLVPESMLSSGDERGFVRSPGRRAGQWHPLLQARLHTARGAGWIRLRRTDGCSFVMNPDGPLHLLAGGARPQQLLLGPCRTGMIAPDIDASAYCTGSTGRLIEFWSAA
jgi:hypothetical protein